MIKMNEILKSIANNRMFSAEQRMAMDNCIGFFLVGSHLYGTNTKDSDLDYEGLFIEAPEYRIGCKRIDEVNFSSGPSDRRNTEKDIDVRKGI